MNFIIFSSSFSNPVCDEKSRLIPLAHPSRPNFEELIPVGIDIGISLLTTFQIALERNKLSFNHVSCSDPNMVLLFSIVSGISFLLRSDLARSEERRVG